MSDKAEEEEVWKTYPELPFIEASSLGRVRTVDHWVTYKNGRRQLYKGHVLKQYKERNGYMRVKFSVDGKLVCLLVHRIIAASFLPNPDNLPEVNHKDNDRTNNSVDNLEWCTSQYNSNYKKNFGTSPAQIYGQLFGRPVIAVNLETSEVLWFESQHEAGRKLGVSYQNINKVVKGQRDKAGGYWFCYADENTVEKVRAKFGDKIARKVEKLIRQNKK